MKKVLLVLIAILCVCALFACNWHWDPSPSYNVGEVGGGNIGGNNVGGSGGESATDRESDLILVYGDYVFYMEDENLRLFKLDNGDIILIDCQELPFIGKEMLLSDEGVNVIGRERREFAKEDEPDKTDYIYTTEVVVFDVPQDDEYKFEVKNQYSLYGRFFNAKIIADELYISAVIYETIEEAIGLGFRFYIEEFNSSDDVKVPQSSTSSVFYRMSTKSAYTVDGSLTDFFVQDGKILSILDYKDSTTSMVALHDETLKIKGYYYEDSYLVCNSAAANGDCVYLATYSIDKGINFTVLSGDNLEKVGELRDLYPAEILTGAKFGGGNFYFKTKKWKDDYYSHLYQIDVSDPTKPQIVDDLGLGSYSTHLYVVNDNNMIMFTNTQIELYSLSGAIERKDSIDLPDLKWTLFGSDTRMVFFDKGNERMYVFTGLEIEKAYWELIAEKCENGDYDKDEIYDKIVSEEFFTDEEKEKIMNMKMSGSFYVIEYTDEELKVVHKFEDLRTGRLSFDVRDIRCIVKDGYIYVLYNGMAYSFNATDFTEKCVLDYERLNNDTTNDYNNDNDSENNNEN